MSKKLILLVVLFFCSALPLKAQNKINDYLNIPGPLKIDNKSYNLVWSSHPNDNYYKQEYLSPNEKIEKYNTLVMIDYIQGNLKPEDVIDQKVTELENLKKSNPVVNYKTYENNGEYILDFLITENSKDGKEILIAERNVYRYKLISNNKNKGVLLFAVSERGYKENIEKFFNNLKNDTSKLIEAVGNYQLPNIEIK
ncbi:hypothetical protein CEY12_19880 [Chryseobacterium sp. T16E-39]|uniref:hypothetical protein n=1 Tax=Chryseobacterium sp. T16E-39 TaxID=2015076 RepID=UPI000B5B4316|nr:hypothetical protein [Chryseobacterium sp. T16E-39]ASK32209.1 hypothetical protein CEY12_19880 [Chryseobacterium sp. T16E-39]